MKVTEKSTAELRLQIGSILKEGKKHAGSAVVSGASSAASVSRDEREEKMEEAQQEEEEEEEERAVEEEAMDVDEGVVGKVTPSKTTGGEEKKTGEDASVEITVSWCLFERKSTENPCL